MSALLLSPVALTACSAGQVAQTAQQNRDKVGAQVNVGNLYLREVQLPYPVGGVYASGQDARLLAGIVSTSAADDTLTSITGTDFDSVQVVDPTATAAAATGAAAAGARLNIAVPAQGTVFLGNGTGPAVTLVGLSRKLTVGDYVKVTFTFEQAGKVTIPVPVAPSAREVPRGNAYDFQQNQNREQKGGGPG
jgi:copper(I)-binding protein